MVDHIESIRLNPKAAGSFENFAQLWMKSTDVSFRDGKLVLGLATRACELTGWQEWTYLAALAAAHAEFGAFDEAARWATQSLALAPEGEQAHCRERLAIYESRRN